MPPCSGIKSPKSLRPASRLSIEAVKSPTNPNNASRIPWIGPRIPQYGHFWTHAPSVARTKLNAQPPSTPSTVLFGLVFPAAGLIAPNFVLPNFRPAKYPPTSLNAMQSHDQTMKFAPVVIGKWRNLGSHEGTLIEEVEVILARRSSSGWMRGARRVGCLLAPISLMLRFVVVYCYDKFFGFVENGWFMMPIIMTKGVRECFIINVVKKKILTEPKRMECILKWTCAESQSKNEY